MRPLKMKSFLGGAKFYFFAVYFKFVYKIFTFDKILHFVQNDKK